MGILNLPIELLLLIADDLPISDLSHLVSTNRRLSYLLTPYFHKLALQDVGRCSAFLWAVIHGHASLAELAISNGAEVDKLASDDLQTPLHVAAELDHPDVIHVLVKHGARIDATNHSIQTPLHRAVYCRSPLAIRALLELGADMTCIDWLGNSPPRVAARLGLIDCLRPFLDAGLDFTDKDTKGRTILHDAIDRGLNMDDWDSGSLADDRGAGMVGYILDSGGDGIVNAQDFTGATPLHVAGDFLWLPEKVVMLLLRYGADAELEDNQGRKPDILDG